MFTTTKTAPAYHPGRDMAPHFRSLSHFYRFVVDGLCQEVHKPSFRSRVDYVAQLQAELRFIGRHIESYHEEGGARLNERDCLKVCTILETTWKALDWEGTKADNGARVRSGLNQIEAIIVDDIDSCTCATEPGYICFAETHVA